jgi:hypothetical protein
VCEDLLDHHGIFDTRNDLNGPSSDQAGFNIEATCNCDSGPASISSPISVVNQKFVAFQSPTTTRARPSSRPARLPAGDWAISTLSPEQIAEAR